MNENPDANMDQGANIDSSGNTNADAGKNEQICRDYQRGVCSRGDKCKFAHPQGMGSEPKDQPMICRDFQNGTCNRSTCKYLHVSNQEEKNYMRTGELPDHLRGGAPPRAAPVPRSDAGGPVCKDFMNNKCNRGASCKFQHVQEEENFGGGFYNEPPRKRPREGFDNDYRYLMEENVSLRRKVSELQKEVADLRATNDILLDQNARYRRSASSSSTPSGYGGGYGTSDDRSRSYGGGSVSYPSRDSYPPAVSYNHSAYAAPKPAAGPPAGSGYDGYTKFEWANVYVRVLSVL